MNVVEAKNLEKIYSDADLEVRAVDGVSLNEAKKAMELAAAKIPIKCKFISREIE